MLTSRAISKCLKFKNHQAITPFDSFLVNQNSTVHQATILQGTFLACLLSPLCIHSGYREEDKLPGNKTQCFILFSIILNHEVSEIKIQIPLINEITCIGFALKATYKLTINELFVLCLKHPRSRHSFVASLKEEKLYMFNELESFEIFVPAMC